jgi:hypothetical protein
MPDARAGEVRDGDRWNAGSSRGILLPTQPSRQELILPIPWATAWTGEPMSSRPAQKITHPAELRLPARPERVSEVFASLGPDGKTQFISELVEALFEARQTDNLRPLQDVVEGWYRTLVANRSPDYEAAVAWAGEHEPAAEDLLDLQQLRERLDS